MRRPVSVRISSCTSVTPASKASRSVRPSTVERSKISRACRPRMLSLSMCRNRRAASETSTARPSAGKQQDAVLQIAENLVEILLQCGKDLLHIAHALPDLLDLCRDPLRRVALLAAASLPPPRWPAVQ